MTHVSVPPACFIASAALVGWKRKPQPCLSHQVTASCWTETLHAGTPCLVLQPLEAAEIEAEIECEIRNI